MATENHRIVYDFSIVKIKALLVLVKISIFNIFRSCVDCPNANVATYQLNVKLVL